MGTARLAVSSSGATCSSPPTVAKPEPGASLMPTRRRPSAWGRSQARPKAGVLTPAAANGRNTAARAPVPPGSGSALSTAPGPVQATSGASATETTTASASKAPAGNEQQGSATRGQTPVQASKTWPATGVATSAAGIPASTPNPPRLAGGDRHGGPAADGHGHRAARPGGDRQRGRDGPEEGLHGHLAVAERRRRGPAGVALGERAVSATRCGGPAPARP